MIDDVDDNGIFPTLIIFFVSSFTPLHRGTSAKKKLGSTAYETLRFISHISCYAYSRHDDTVIVSEACAIGHSPSKHIDDAFSLVSSAIFVFLFSLLS